MKPSVIIQGLFCSKSTNSWLDFISCTDHNTKVSTSSFSALSSQEILQRDLIFQKSGWICKKCPSEEKFEQKFQFVSHWHKNHSRGITYEVCQWCCELFDYPSISQNVSIFFSTISQQIFDCMFCFNSSKNQFFIR